MGIALVHVVENASSSYRYVKVVEVDVDVDVDVGLSLGVEKSIVDIAFVVEVVHVDDMTALAQVLAVALEKNHKAMVAVDSMKVAVVLEQTVDVVASVGNNVDCAVVVDNSLVEASYVEVDVTLVVLHYIQMLVVVADSLAVSCYGLRWLLPVYVAPN